MKNWSIIDRYFIGEKVLIICLYGVIFPIFPFSWQKSIFMTWIYFLWWWHNLSNKGEFLLFHRKSFVVDCPCHYRKLAIWWGLSFRFLKFFFIWHHLIYSYWKRISRSVIVWGFWYYVLKFERRSVSNAMIQQEFL